MLWTKKLIFISKTIFQNTRPNQNAQAGHFGSASGLGSLKRP